MDKASWLGLIIGFGGIILGNSLEGGHFSALIQATAFLIVFCGTLGAVFLNSTGRDLRMAKNMMGSAFSESNTPKRVRLVNELVRLASVAKKEGVLGIEEQIKKMPTAYMQTVFRFIVDGVEPKHMKSILKEQIYIEEDHKMAGSKVFMDAGSYAPTIGILGAVLGLIHIMANLTDTSSLGAGIAIAFVATIYGVASANLLFLPIANKIKSKIQYEAGTQEMVLSAALAIYDGVGPSLLQEKLNAYLVGE
ncbi:MAG: flagellar motor protein [Bdellovibrionales bacterium]